MQGKRKNICEFLCSPKISSENGFPQSAEERRCFASLSCADIFQWFASFFDRRLCDPHKKLSCCLASCQLFDLSHERCLVTLSYKRDHDVFLLWKAKFNTHTHTHTHTHKGRSLSNWVRACCHFLKEMRVSHGETHFFCKEVVPFLLWVTVPSASALKRACTSAVNTHKSFLVTKSAPCVPGRDPSLGGKRISSYAIMEWGTEGRRSGWINE